MIVKTILFIAILVVALLDWLAVARGWKKIEYLAKPATMVFLLGYLVFSGGFIETPLAWFGLGLIFSLAGDTFLMVSFYRFSNRWFLPGLAAFLLAHALWECPPCLGDRDCHRPGSYFGPCAAAHRQRGAREGTAADGRPGGDLWDGHHPDAPRCHADPLSGRLENSRLRAGVPGSHPVLFLRYHSGLEQVCQAG